MKVVLATTSEFKNKILDTVHIKHLKVDSDFDESKVFNDDVYEYVKMLALGKAESIKDKVSVFFNLGCLEFLAVLVFFITFLFFFIDSISSPSFFLSFIDFIIIGIKYIKLIIINISRALSNPIVKDDTININILIITANTSVGCSTNIFIKNFLNDLNLNLTVLKKLFNFFFNLLIFAFISNSFFI